MKKLSATLLCLFLLVPACVRTASAQTADAVVEAYLAALGGREALGKVTSRKATGTATVTTPGGPISGPIELVLRAPNKSRMHMTLDLRPLGGAEMTIDRGFDGTHGYMKNSMQGTTEVAGSELENLRNNILPSPLLTYKESGTKIELLPQEKVAGKDTVVLLVTPKTGSVVRIYLDSQTHLVVRTITKISTPETGEIEQTSDLSDYRTVDGIKVAFHIENTNPVQSLTIVFSKVEHNLAVDDAIFLKK